MKLGVAVIMITGAWTAVGLSAANAGILNFQAELKGAPHARGEVNAALDTDRRVLDYTVTYSGLTDRSAARSTRRQARRW